MIGTKYWAVLLCQPGFSTSFLTPPHAHSYPSLSPTELCFRQLIRNMFPLPWSLLCPAPDSSSVFIPPRSQETEHVAHQSDVTPDTQSNIHSVNYSMLSWSFSLRFKPLDHQTAVGLAVPIAISVVGGFNLRFKLQLRMLPLTPDVHQLTLTFSRRLCPVNMCRQTEGGWLAHSRAMKHRPCTLNPSISEPHHNQLCAALRVR